MSRLLLRLTFVVALFVMLNIPHFGMIAMADTPSMTMHQSGDGQGQMHHTGGVHDGMSGALCATLCAGTDGIERFVHVARAEQFALVSWTIDAVPVRTPCYPDPAQRPPDTTPDA
ncbi:MAG: hypothetical protein ACOH2H_18830 [Cypionkella sp.]